MTSEDSNGLRDFMVHKGERLGKIVQYIVQDHNYSYRDKGSKPSDPGWHRCSCMEWEGYWVSFAGHVGDVVADELERLGLIVARDEQPGKERPCTTRPPHQSPQQT